MTRVLFFALMCCLVFSVPRSGRADDLGALVTNRQAHPDSAESVRSLEASVGAGLPDRMPDAWLSALPADVTPLPYDLGTLVVPKAYLPTHATEEQHGWLFGKVAYLYLPADPPAGQGQAGQTLRLFCAVHYPSEDDAALAVRVARLLSLAHQTLTQKTGHEAANGGAPFQVWLCTGGQTGGEQWRSNLYLYDLKTPRSSIEWIREIVHEYSHLALPGIGGYSAPEYWANGYLGERLIVRWLMRAPDGTARVQAVWGDFSGAANFDRLLLAPALAQYAKIGPNPAWLARRDEAGMRYLIGQALTFDDKYGSRRLGDALALLPRFHEATARDFAQALGASRAASQRASR